MSDQPHRPALDQPHRLNSWLDQPDQPHRLNPWLDQPDQPRQLELPLGLPDQRHAVSQRDQPHRLDERHLPHWPGLPLPTDLPQSQASSDSKSGQSSSPSESTSADSPGSSDSPAEPKKICYTCAQFLPASQFRFRNRTTGVRMTECRTCYNKRERDRHRKKRAREKSWAIQKTASQIARSSNLARTLALLENLVDVMGGPEKLVERWHEECWKLTNQKRSSTRLVRMHEMLIVLVGQTRGAKHQRAAASPPKAAS